MTNDTIRNVTGAATARVVLLRDATAAELERVSGGSGYCGAGSLWQAAGTSPALPCCHGVGTSHFEQAPSISPNATSPAGRSSGVPARPVNDM